MTTPKPKPTRESRPKLSKSLPLKKRKTPNRRKVLNQQLEDICKLIVHWRDGAECVERHVDGARCGGGIQWGHYIPRSESKWLKYDLGNSFSQCRNHNNLHDKGSQTMGTWFTKEFSQEVADAMQAERNAHRGGEDRPLFELEEMIAEYTELYQNRFYVNAGSLYDLIVQGFYGKVVQDSWNKMVRSRPK